ncbi:MAG: hypothetical protein QG657_3588 [Acidobacteriota bacterium]|nr:hypothetical protein [Acidobacteriota bacterium]
MVSLCLLFGMLVFSQVPIDLSEKIMKIKGQYPVNFEDQGFGVYDWGEKKYKIFDWNFNIVQSFPIAIGEGPAEVKPYVYNSFIFNEKVYVNGFLSRVISIYSYKGAFAGSLSLDITPHRILLHNKNIFVLNSAVIDSPTLPFVQVLDIDTGKKLKEIRLKSPIPKPKDLGHTISMYFIHYDIGADELIYMLHALDNSLVIIDMDGNIVKRLKLPHEARINYNASKDGNNVMVTLDTLDFYHDIAYSKNGIYLSFLKTEKIGETLSDWVFKTYLVKWSNNGKFQEKVFDGDLVILGEYKNTLYLFNRDEYTLLPVELF